MRHHIDRKRFEKSQRKSIHDVFRERKESEALAKQQEAHQKLQTLSPLLQSYEPRLTDDTRPSTLHQRKISSPMVSTTHSTQSDKDNDKDHRQEHESGPGHENISTTNPFQAMTHTFPALRSSMKKTYSASDKERPHSGRVGEGIGSSSTSQGGYLSIHGGNISNHGDDPTMTMLSPSDAITERQPSTSSYSSHHDHLQVHDLGSSSSSRESRKKSSTVLLDVMATKVSFKDADLLSKSQQSRRLSDAMLVIDDINEHHHSIEMNDHPSHPNDEDEEDDENKQYITSQDGNEDGREGVVEGSGSSYESNAMSPRPATTGSPIRRMSSPNKNNNNYINNDNNNDNGNNNDNNEDNQDQQLSSTDFPLNSSSLFHHRQSTSHQESSITIPPLHVTSSSSRAQTAQGLGPARAPSKKSIDNTVR